ncbi:MAG: endo-alpha-N-acetylgalactosaminidase family protein [Agriterribacter sp.]
MTLSTLRYFTKLLALLLLSISSFSQKIYDLQSIIIHTDKKVLNPVLHPSEYASLSVTGIRKSGSTVLLPAASLRYMIQNKLASGDAPIASIQGNRVIPQEGGIATVTAVYSDGNNTFSATTDIVVRPYYREYHQALVMKLFMGMEGEPVERLAKDPFFQKPHDVLCTFEQALELIKRTDHLTQGIPKIIYLVGWQKGGHDHEYPSWATVNDKMKRPQDETALQSLRWLIREARQYHTTVSLHINMVDAYKHSPLWDEYLKKDILGRDENGNLLATDIGIKGDSMYKVSYTREWAEGLAQKRIDALIAMIPELYEGHTIHVDVFIAKPEFYPTISPWHAKKENGGIDIYKEVETQRKIFKYWRTKGFDVAGEGIFWAHPPGEGFYGLQPMSWWYPDDISYQMQTPEYLSARGMTSRTDDGDFRFGSSIHGEDLFQKSISDPPGFLGQFCRNTLMWYYLSRLERLALVNDTLFYSDGVKAAKENGHNIIRKGNFLFRDNNDLLVPALWKNEKTIIAYSEEGYQNKKWLLPSDWQTVKKVDVYVITAAGDSLLQRNLPVENNSIMLSVKAGMAVVVKAQALQVNR